MQINLISVDNGRGLSADIEILSRALSEAGIYTKFKLASVAPSRRDAADINIFLEVLNPAWYRAAKKNILIPNQEWFFNKWVLEFAHLDAVFCKTHCGVDIFSKLGANAIYSGFTSRDRFNPHYEKDFEKALHLAGKSPFKGTDCVLKVWSARPDFPTLFLCRHPLIFSSRLQFPNVKDLKAVLTEESVTRLMNTCGLHLCVSEVEGFGHYIWEALSCGAIVVTTDAPPMNEAIPDTVGFKVSWKERCPVRLGTRFLANPRNLECVVSKILSLSERERQTISQLCRNHFLNNDRMFRARIINLVKAL
jgi:Glycosyl transferases group 1